MDIIEVVNAFKTRTNILLQRYYVAKMKYMI